MTNKQSFSVSGTSCASCEVLIERELKQIDGVLDVKVSHANGSVEIIAEANKKITPGELDRALGSRGYSFGEADSAIKQKFSYRKLGGTFVIILALYLVLSKSGFLNYSPSVEQSGGLGAVFLIGLVAAFSSCTAVVSGLVVAVSTSAAKTNPNRTTFRKMVPHILFNSGRLAGFAGFGALIGLAGSVLTLSPTMNALLVLSIAALMIILGLNLLEIAPNGWFKIRPPKRLAHKIHRLSDSDEPLIPLVLGAGTFFLPCGFTQSMQLFALSTGNPAKAALIMSVFALGTIPALLGVGYASSVAKGRSLRLLTKAAGAFVVVIGLSNIMNGAVLMGVSLPKTEVSAADPSLPSLVDGKQYIQMEITDDFTYQPAVLTVVEDVPVVWAIYGSKRMGCADTLVSRQLGISTQLEPGINQVEFTPDRPGIYTFSCSMGMIQGTMIVKSES